MLKCYTTLYLYHLGLFFFHQLFFSMLSVHVVVLRRSDVYTVTKLKSPSRNSLHDLLKARLKFK